MTWEQSFVQQMLMAYALLPTAEQSALLAQFVALIDAAYGGFPPVAPTTPSVAGHVAAPPKK